MLWQTTRFAIDLNRPQVMGIVNVTPDSFSDGGQYASRDAALRALRTACSATERDMLDIGGESTRPGALALPLDEELARVLPVVRHAVTLGVPVSVDTYKPQVMQAVLDLGADIINDIWALRWQTRWHWRGGRGAPALRRLPDAHAPRSADHAGGADGRAM